MPPRAQWDTVFVSHSHQSHPWRTSVFWAPRSVFHISRLMVSTFRTPGKVDHPNTMQKGELVLTHFTEKGRKQVKPIDWKSRTWNSLCRTRMSPVFQVSRPEKRLEPSARPSAVSLGAHVASLLRTRGTLGLLDQAT